MPPETLKQTFEPNHWNPIFIESAYSTQLGYDSKFKTSALGQTRDQFQTQKIGSKPVRANRKVVNRTISTRLSNCFAETAGGSGFTNARQVVIVEGNRAVLHFDPSQRLDMASVSQIIADKSPLTAVGPEFGVVGARKRSPLALAIAVRIATSNQADNRPT